jgi:Ca2+-binding EF-hand superfamily protein
MDENGSRTIDREELATGLNEFGLSMSGSSVDELFQFLDKQCSGLITFDEFLQALRVSCQLLRVELDSRYVPAQWGITVCKLSTIS